MTPYRWQLTWHYARVTSYLTGEPITPWSWGFSGLVCLHLSSLSPLELEGIDTCCIHHFSTWSKLFQRPTTPRKKKNFLSLIHPGFSNFNVWPLVGPLLTFHSFVDSSLMSIVVNPHYILKTSIRSCLFPPFFQRTGDPPIVHCLTQKRRSYYIIACSCCLQDACSSVQHAL